MQKSCDMSGAAADVAHGAPPLCLTCKMREQLPIERLVLKLVKQVNGVLARQPVVVVANGAGDVIDHV